MQINTKVMNERMNTSDSDCAVAALIIETSDPRRLAAFWGAMLAREVTLAEGSVELPGSATQPTLRFVPGDAPPGKPNRMHLHLTSDTAAHQEAQVALALQLGGRHHDVGQRPEDGHVVLADPDDNEFCVIEANNGYLAGCGPLGEFAGDGRAITGAFWRDVLGWPFVWNQGEERVIQHPDGGTKYAWGGPPLTPKTARNRHRLALAAADVDAALARLLALGARLGAAPDAATIVLIDPDDNEFELESAQHSTPT